MEDNGLNASRPVACRNLGTRAGFVAAIRDCGQFIIDHAEGLLGDYPGANLSEMSITAYFDFDGIPKVVVDRTHLVGPNYGV